MPAPQDGGGHARRDARRLWKSNCEHGGVRFPAPYRPLGLTLKVNNRSKLSVPPSAEEFVVQYAKLAQRDHPATKDRRFRHNFLVDLGAIWPNLPHADPRGWDTAAVLEEYAKKQAQRAKHHASRKPSNTSSSPRRMAPNLAVVDGEPVRTTRSTVDRAGIFVARSPKHPLHGRLRRAVSAADVTLNLSDGARVPKGGWKGVVHEPMITWIARWNDPLTREPKYVFLDRGAELVQHHERRKFELARAYGRRAAAIQLGIMRELAESVEALRGAARDLTKAAQVAACIAIIHEFGIRLGSDEQRRPRDGSESTDAVGAISLRVSDVALRAANKTKTVKLKFVGKDGVPFDAARAVPPPLFAALEILVTNRDGKDLLFPSATPDAVNERLDELLEGLTAKVIRTQRASALMDLRLRELAPAGRRVRPSKLDDRMHLVGLKVAELEVARFLNHRSGIFVAGTENMEAARARFQRALDAFYRAFSGNDESSAKNAARAVEQAADDLRLAPGTARDNYVDPRIVFAYCKRTGLDPSVVFGPAQLRRAAWAASASSRFEF